MGYRGEDVSATQGDRRRQTPWQSSSDDYPAAESGGPGYGPDGGYLGQGQLGQAQPGYGGQQDSQYGPPYGQQAYEAPYGQTPGQPSEQQQYGQQPGQYNGYEPAPGGAAGYGGAPAYGQQPGYGYEQGANPAGGYGQPGYDPRSAGGYPADGGYQGPADAYQGPGGYQGPDGGQYQGPGGSSGYQGPGGYQDPSGYQDPNGYAAPGGGYQGPGTGYQEPGYQEPGYQGVGGAYQGPGDGYQSPGGGGYQDPNGYAAPGGYQDPNLNGYAAPGGGYQDPGNQNRDNGYGQSSGYPALPAGQSGSYPAQDAGNDWYGGQPAAANGASFADTGSYSLNGRVADEYGTGPSAAMRDPARGYPPGAGQQADGQLPTSVLPTISGSQAAQRSGPMAAQLSGPQAAYGSAQPGYDQTAAYPGYGQQDPASQPGYDQTAAYPGYGQQNPAGQPGRAAVGLQTGPDGSGGPDAYNAYDEYATHSDYAAPGAYGGTAYDDFDRGPTPQADPGRDGYGDSEAGDPYQDRYGGGNAGRGGAGRGSGGVALGPLRGKRLLIAVAAVIAVGIIGVAAYLFVLKPGSTSSGSTAQGPLPTSGSEPSQQACAAELGTYCHIETRADDPTALTTAELFPPAFTNDTDKISYQLVSTKVDKTCANAVIGTSLISALKSGQCTQVLRGSYVSGNGKIMGTIGVVNLTTTNEAHDAGKVVGQNDFIAPLTASKGVASKLGNGTGVVEAEYKGHYLILTWSEFVNGTSPTTTAENDQLEQFGNDLVAGTANIYLSQRMVTGATSTASAAPSTSASK
jgi:hypothetical protein